MLGITITKLSGRQYQHYRDRWILLRSQTSLSYTTAENSETLMNLSDLELDSPVE